LQVIAPPSKWLKNRVAGKTDAKWPQGRLRRFFSFLADESPLSRAILYEKTAFPGFPILPKLVKLCRHLGLVRIIPEFTLARSASEGK
jgi:hypothetical protein